MARLLRIAHTSIRHSFSTKPLINVHSNQFRKPITPTLFHNRAYSSDAIMPTSLTSPLTANMLRILRTEIECQSESAPPHQPPASFNSFAVEDRPGEQWITMSGKFGETEDIKIEVTMFDGYEAVPKSGDDDSSGGVDVRLHLSVIVDVSKGDGSDNLEFLCSVWPDCVEVQKVYVLQPGRVRAKPYLGPNVRGLKSEIQKKLGDYLEARGVNDELCVFLHQYMMNKDRIELIRWLRNVMSAVER